MKIRQTLSIAIHITILVSLVLFIIFPITFQFILPREFWYTQIYTFIIWIAVFYANMYYIVPKFLLRGRSFEFSIIALLIVISTILINQKLAEFHDLINKMDLTFKIHEGATDPRYKLVSTFITTTITLLLLGVGTIIKVGDKLEADKTKEQDLQRENVSSELAFLKAQINPHFLFNILHSIYALTETDVIKSQDAIYTLSKMLRYVLYDSKHVSTTIDKEIYLIENYIKMMRLRTGDNTAIIFTNPGMIFTQSIAPMLLLPFVENAFKHGVNSFKKSFISITLNQTEDYIQLIVINSMFPQKQKDLDDENGIGLLNTRRRLELLYPKKHILKTGPNRDFTEYTTDLKIYLT